MFGFAALAFLQPYALLIKIGLALVLLAVAAYAWHLFTDHYRDQGRAEVREKYTALLSACDASKMTPDNCALDWAQLKVNNATLEGNLNSCRSTLVNQSNGIKLSAEVGEQVRKATQQIIADARVREKNNEATQFVRELRTALTAPAAPTKEKECENLARAVDAASDRWLRYYSDPDAARKGGSVQSAPAPGGGALRISR